MPITLRLTGRQEEELYRHLFPGDGDEAVAVGVCGRHYGQGDHVLTLRVIQHIPYDECSVRAPDRVTWSTKRLEELLVDATRRGHAVIKFHSHPGDYDQFSKVDNASDSKLFASVHGWTDGPDPHVSAVMLPSRRIFARAVHPDGTFEEIRRVAVAGEDLAFYDAHEPDEEPSLGLEHDRQARCFGEASTRLMRRLSVGVVGCSGTGGPTIEMLGRLGVGRLVLVDPDTVGRENLNRIPNTTRQHAERGAAKAQVLADAVRLMGMGTTVDALTDNLAESPRAVRTLAGCDVLFGCVDSAEGRHILNRIATFYCLPYFDVGVKLEASVEGVIDEVCGTVHYLTPDGSSLMDRGVYDDERLRAEGMRRADPEGYGELLRDNYIQGADETSPAVVSVNTFFASRMVNEFLSRVHPYRLDPNSEFTIIRESLSQMARYCKRDDDFPSRFAGHVGRGDVVPLLDMPQFSGLGGKP